MIGPGEAIVLRSLEAALIRFWGEMEPIFQDVRGDKMFERNQSRRTLEISRGNWSA
jgi:hypothetical protein